MPNARLLPILFFATLCLPSCGIRFMRKSLPEEKLLTSAPSGMALVNFHRPSTYAKGADFPIFDGEQLIGNSDGRVVFQYTCPPGEHVFLGTANSASVVKADLAADQVYDIEVRTGMGVWRASVSMDPLVKGHANRAKLPEWERKERLWIFVDDDAAKRFQKARSEWARKTIADFVGGEKEDRLKTMGPDDHR